MSAGGQAADIPISAPSSQRTLSQGVPASSRSEEVLAEIVQKDDENADNQFLMTEKVYGNFAQLSVAELKNQLRLR